MTSKRVAFLAVLTLLVSASAKERDSVNENQIVDALGSTTDLSLMPTARKKPVMRTEKQAKLASKNGEAVETMLESSGDVEEVALLDGSEGSFAHKDPFIQAMLQDKGRKKKIMRRQLPKQTVDQENHPGDEEHVPVSDSLEEESSAEQSGLQDEVTGEEGHTIKSKEEIMHAEASLAAFKQKQKEAAGPLRAELSVMKASDLRSRAQELGISEETIADADDADDLHAALVEIIVKHFDSAAESLRAELNAMKESALQVRAEALGVSGDAMNKANASKDRKAALVELILMHNKERMKNAEK